MTTPKPPARFDEHALRQAANHLDVPRLRQAIYDAIEAHDDLRERCLIAELRFHNRNDTSAGAVALGERKP